MSELIKHECGIAMVRLLKPLSYYEEKYGSPLYGFNKLFLLMEKQHNRGQDGAGIGCVKLQTPRGEAYMFRARETGNNSLSKIFSKEIRRYDQMVRKGKIHPEFPDSAKSQFDFAGEVLLGHLRYGTSGNYDKGSCHPYFRKSIWPTRNLMVAGNFNMTNVEALNKRLTGRGAHPIFDTDTQTVLEEIGYHLDEAHTEIYHGLRDGGMDGDLIPDEISRRLDPARIIFDAGNQWDGGYTIAGVIGNGDAFVVRDPSGIRPAFYFADDEVVAVASERVALMTIFDKAAAAVEEVNPGCVVVVKADGKLYEKQVFTRRQRLRCSFERIYFSRGNDPDIYRERKALGAALCGPVMRLLDNDLKNSVFSYIPNTAETAYYGMMDELRVRRREEVREALLTAAAAGSLTEKLVDDLIMDNWPRGEKIAHKDIKLRTFISQEKSRVQLASHVYDISYGVVQAGDNLVCIDDSIVRGTTLKQSILRILSRTNPKRIVIASTAPQIRYPDCYGIDMSELGKFIAFQAAIQLCSDTGCGELVREVYEDCVKQADKPAAEMVNHVKRLYEPFSVDQLSTKISELVRPKLNDWSGEVHIIFQGIDALHQALGPDYGDWYFTGDYPTPGGYSVLNRAFMFYYEKRDGRSY